ncbi:MAG: hypothetical protein ACFUZC_04945 [Chthoniobacteraceae bacterium]
MAEKNTTATQQEGSDANLEFAQALELPAEIASLLMADAEPAPNAAAAKQKKNNPTAETDTETETETETETDEGMETETETETDEGTETETETETDEGTETETETETDEETEEGPEVSPKTQAAFSKRIAEVTKARREAEEQAEALKIENESLKARMGNGTPAPTQNDPLANVTTEAELRAKVEFAQSAKAWALKNLKGATLPDGKGGEVEYSADQVGQILTDADALLTVHIPRRADYLKNSVAFEERAKEKFPELYKPESVDAKLADAIVRELPELKRFPNQKVILGYLVAALKTEQAEAKDGKTSKTKKETKTVKTVFESKGKQPIAPGAPVRSAAAPRKPVQDETRTQAAQLQHVAEAGGSEEALAAAFA